MKEQLISLETAKLAKEKGFDAWCHAWYYKRALVSMFSDGEAVGIKRRYQNFQYKDVKFNNEDTTYAAPTQSLLQKWLREEYRINVESNYLPNIQKYKCLYVPMTKAIPNREKYSLRSKYYGIDNHETYEQALEKGLQEALKLIE